MLICTVHGYCSNWPHPRRACLVRPGGRIGTTGVPFLDASLVDAVTVPQSPPEKNDALAPPTEEVVHEIVPQSSPPAMNLALAQQTEEVVHDDEIVAQFPPQEQDSLLVEEIEEQSRLLSKSSILFWRRLRNGYGIT